MIDTTGNIENLNQSELADRSSFNVLSLLQKYLPFVILITLPLLIFYQHIAGNLTWIGNPDRLNSHLKILKFHVEGLASGHINAWNDYEMMGYDTFTMPYTFPNILTYISKWLGIENLYISAGYISLSLLILAGIATYFFINHLTHRKGISLVGAICYQFSSLTLLKVSQNDMSFAVFIVIPLLALIIHKLKNKNIILSYISLTGLFFLMLNFMFLQKASYALIFVGFYALYRSILNRTWLPVVMVSSAFITAFIGAFPRIYGIGIALSQYARDSNISQDLTNFSSSYNYHHIFPSEILRWLDGTIFGRYPSETAVLNQVNMTEGFLLYTSAFVPFLMLYGLVRYQKKWFTLPFSKTHDVRFFFWFLVFTFGVVVLKPLLFLIFIFYQRIDFTHARILIVGLLPLVTLISLILMDLYPRDLNNHSLMWRSRISAGAVIAAVIIVGGIEVVARQKIGYTDWPAPLIKIISLFSISALLSSLFVTLILLSLFYVYPQVLNKRFFTLGKIPFVGAIAILIIGGIERVANFASSAFDIFYDNSHHFLIPVSFSTLFVAIIFLVLLNKYVGDRDKPSFMRQWWIPVTVAIIVVSIVGGRIVQHAINLLFIPDASSGLGFFRPLQLRHEAIVRIILSGTVSVLLMLGITTIRGKFEWVRLFAYQSFCFCIVLQVLTGAYFQVNNPHTVDPDTAFENGNFHYASRGDFHSPENAVIRKLQERLENNDFRTILICDPVIAGGFCAGHVSEFWNLRTVDGYYGIGVPSRLSSLPWTDNISLRTISFHDTKEIPWEMLSLVNVKYALIANSEIYRNGRELDVKKLTILKNPTPAVPRVFFTSSVIPIKDIKTGVAYLFQNKKLIDVTKQSVVEGINKAQHYVNTGKILLTGAGDHLEIMVEKSKEARFLVLNELYFPGWTAKINGKEIPIFPANVTARGLVVPAGVDKIVLQYTPFVCSDVARYFYYGSILLFIGFIIYYRGKKSYFSSKVINEKI